MFRATLVDTGACALEWAVVVCYWTLVWVPGRLHSQPKRFVVLEKCEERIGEVCEMVKRNFSDLCQGNLSAARQERSEIFLPVSNGFILLK